MRQATSRGSIPERRSAHAVSATPPAPAAANRRVAASAGHRDLIALEPADAALPAHEHGAEQHDVAGERQQLEHHADRDPPAVAALDAVHRRADARELRQHEVEERRRPSARTRRSAIARRRVTDDARHLLVVRRLRLGPRPRGCSAPALLAHAHAPRCCLASCAIASSVATAAAMRSASGAARGAEPPHRHRSAPRRRAGPRRSARRGTPARTRASPRRRSRARPRPVPPRRAEARPSRMWRSAARASRPGDCLRTHCRASPSRLARSARRTRPSCAAPPGRRRRSVLSGAAYHGGAVGTSQ